MKPTNKEKNTVKNIMRDKSPIIYVSALLLLLTMLNTRITYGQSVENNLDAPKKAFILSRFCSEVKYNFVHYNKLKINWDSLCIANLPRLTATHSDEEFMDELKKICAQLHDGHTFLYIANTPGDEANWIRPFPMETKRIGDRVFVTSVYNSKFKEQGLDAGCEVLKIDGENVIEYGERHISPFFPSSTPQWSKYAPFNNFELTKDKGTKVSTIDFRTPKGKTFTISSNRNISWDIENTSSVFDFKVLKNKIGILTIRNFQSGNFKKEDFDKIYNDILATNALIIDIRNNGGGNSSYADYVIRHFDNKPIRVGRWSSRMYIAAHASWNFPQEWYTESPDAMNPISDKPIYKKPLALLVNACTFSSAENFCVTFRGLNRGKIIGTPTGGSTGNPIFIDLGFGVSCGICTKNEWDVDNNEFIGIGIIPDIEVEENASIYLNGKDNVIETAINMLKKNL
ncbi:S41 family peptidase [Parabacteroides sp. AM08-6]|uniref:S41 family peptidase n=1 Tax=Parabacteroides sp. AM08-6 TaxID=2292053 RepID=UPI000F009BC8|nr:S41 family peptidase [Parabacteroides sp. AM08-6]RHJ79129.1 peptidase S41 [Parabacteroides sp. AM08-6]